jgi:predicted permease
VKFSFHSLQTLLLYVALNLLLAVSWHLLIFRDVLNAATPFARAQPIVPLGMAAIVVHGALLIAVYPRFHRDDSRWRSGVRFGAAFGMFLAAGAIWVDVGKFEFQDGPTYLLLETAYEILSFSLLGVLIAHRHRPGQHFAGPPRPEPLA